MDLKTIQEMFDKDSKIDETNINVEESSEVRDLVKQIFKIIYEF